MRARGNRLDGWLQVVLLAGSMAWAGCGARERGVTGSGTVEMDEVDIASQIGGRLVELRVREGDPVRTGETLAVLDQGEVIAGLQARQADAGRAVAQLRDVQAGARPAEIEAAAAALRSATAQAELAEHEFVRTQALFDQGVTAPADLDRARSNRDATLARRAMAEDELKLLRAGARVLQVAAARNAARSAEAQLSGAASRARELTLLAPGNGLVLLRNLEPGEIAGPGVPVVTIGDPERLWLRIYVPAPRLAEVRLGAPVEITAPGFQSRKFAGHVIEIASRAEFTPRAALTEEERANLVFGVKVAIDSTGGALKAGLPVDARILPGAGSRATE